MHLAPDASVTDGRLDVVTTTTTSRLKFLKALPKVFKGTHVEESVGVSPAGHLGHPRRRPPVPRLRRRRPGGHPPLHRHRPPRRPPGSSSPPSPDAPASRPAQPSRRTAFLRLPSRMCAPTPSGEREGTPPCAHVGGKSASQAARRRRSSTVVGTNRTRGSSTCCRPRSKARRSRASSTPSRPPGLFPTPADDLEAHVLEPLLPHLGRAKGGVPLGVGRAELRHTVCLADRVGEPPEHVDAAEQLPAQPHLDLQLRRRQRELVERHPRDRLECALRQPVSEVPRPARAAIHPGPATHACQAVGQQLARVALPRSASATTTALRKRSSRATSANKRAGDTTEMPTGNPALLNRQHGDPPMPRGLLPPTTALGASSCGDRRRLADQRDVEDHRGRTPGREPVASEGELLGDDAREVLVPFVEALEQVGLDVDARPDVVSRPVRLARRRLNRLQPSGSACAIVEAPTLGRSSAGVPPARFADPGGAAQRSSTGHFPPDVRLHRANHAHGVLPPRTSGGQSSRWYRRGRAGTGPAGRHAPEVGATQAG